MQIKASLPPGVKDASPQVALKRRYILELLEEKFKRYGFEPLETPALEQLSTLMGKYGNEGDKLLFKVLNSGDFLSALEKEDLSKKPAHVVPKIAKRGLRYDLTVPLARYVAQHYHELHLPFRRYQIQPVWRADRPQKGRYREFLQCDVDIVGSDSLFCEAELLVMTHEILQTLQIRKFVIQLNHRAILTALASYLEIVGKETFLCNVLDKLDKIGREKVIHLLLEGGVSQVAIERAHWLFKEITNPLKALETLSQHLGNIESGKQGIEALKKIGDYIRSFGKRIESIQIIPTLARGMAYYTGAIFEVKVLDETLGSIVGGGRYENLTEIFGLKDIPGIGISFGLERIYDVMESQQLFPDTLLTNTRLLIAPMDMVAEDIAIDYLGKLRAQSICSILYPAGVRMKKVLTYASKKNIPWVAIIGSEEVVQKGVMLKHMESGRQKFCTFDVLLNLVQGNTTIK